MTFATSHLLSDSVPVPIAATLALISGVWSVTFDRPLQAGPVDVPNWTFRGNGNSYDPVTAVAVLDRVQGTSTISDPDPGADVVSYAPPPFDVKSAPGIEAAAFADFPLVTT